MITYIKGDLFNASVDAYAHGCNTLGKMGAALSLKKVILMVFGLIVFLGMLIPQQLVMPVVDAGHNDYNPASFWYYPWGKSVVHKGVDIFAKTGTPVFSSTRGVVIHYWKSGQGR